MCTPIFVSALVLFSAIFANVQSTIVKKCSDNSPLPEVEIQNCDQQPCTLYINTNVTITMKFTAPQKLEHISPSAVATVSGFNVQYPLYQQDACQGIDNTKCPIEEGEVVEYSHDLFILPNIQPVNATLEYSLVDIDRQYEHFECFGVDLQLIHQA